MSDPAEDTIAIVRSRLVTLTKEPWDQPGRWKFGDKEKVHHGSPPRIEWTERGGEFTQEDQQVTGGPMGDIYLDREDFRVTIWHKDRANCKRIMRELMRLLREEVGTDGFSGGQYEWEPDANVKEGRKLHLSVGFNTKVTESEAEPVEFIVQSHTHKTFAVGEQHH